MEPTGLQKGALFSRKTQRGLPNQFDLEAVVRRVNYGLTLQL